LGKLDRDCVSSPGPNPVTTGRLAPPHRRLICIVLHQFASWPFGMTTVSGKIGPQPTSSSSARRISRSHSICLVARPPQGDRQKRTGRYRGWSIRNGHGNGNQWSFQCSRRLLGGGRLGLHSRRRPTDTLRLGNQLGNLLPLAGAQKKSIWVSPDCKWS